MTYYDIQFLKKFISEAKENFIQGEQEEPEERNESEIKPLPFKDQFEFTSDDLGILKGYSAREVSEIMYFLQKYGLVENPAGYWKEIGESIEASKGKKDNMSRSWNKDVKRLEDEYDRYESQKAKYFTVRLNKYLKVFENYPSIKQDIKDKIKEIQNSL